MKTLVSFIGKGVKDTQPGAVSPYKTCKYKMLDGSEYETSLFLNCLLKVGQYRPDNLIIIGTYTSSWSTLLEEAAKDKNDENFCLELQEREEKKEPITPELLARMEKLLSLKNNNNPVKCFAHTDNIDGNGLKDVLSVYEGIVYGITEGSEIIIDITHAFRSMPVLFLSAINARFGATNKSKISFVYGEYIDRSIRDLSSAWDLLQRPYAVAGFLERFDASELIQLLRNAGWGKGAKAVEKLGNIVQSGFFVQIPESIRQLKNSMDTFPPDAPVWLQALKDKINMLLPLREEKDSEVCKRFANIFYEKKMFSSAVMCLQCSLETRLKEKYIESNPSAVFRKYEDFKAQVLEPFYGNKTNRRINDGALLDMRDTRNGIAHYGDSYDAGRPQAVNLKAQYERFLKAVNLIW